ncbi:EFR1 family ferrodoxin [Wukongibacter baidiensis]|uniref:EFR1 family ferrodoxin n=1 Tax=Wukongibacter baidiensis TaxID=1723361 RepID=UPI003D7F762E
MKIFYFTSTGNSLYVAKKLGGELYSIPKVLKEKNLSFEDEKIGIVFPCYFAGTPRIVKEFLKKVELNSDYIFAIMTYGSSGAAGISHFQKTAEKEGIEISYGSELLMIDNYLPFFDIAKQLEKEESKNIDEHLESLIKDINMSKKFILKKNVLEKTLTTTAQFIYSKKTGKNDKKFLVEDSCTSCKICEKVCPVNNISVNTKPEFNHNCDECLACVNLCPTKAIKIKRERGTARFKNIHVDLKEIIEANN